jgi:hypothetical protein
MEVTVAKAACKSLGNHLQICSQADRFSSAKTWAHWLFQVGKVSREWQFSGSLRPLHLQFWHFSMWAIKITNCLIQDRAFFWVGSLLPPSCLSIPSLLYLSNSFRTRLSSLWSRMLSLVVATSFATKSNLKQTWTDWRCPHKLRLRWIPDTSSSSSSLFWSKADRPPALFESNRSRIAVNVFQ